MSQLARQVIVPTLSTQTSIFQKSFNDPNVQVPAPPQGTATTYDFSTGVLPAPSGGTNLDGSVNQEVLVGLSDNTWGQNQYLKFDMSVPPTNNQVMSWINADHAWEPVNTRTFSITNFAGAIKLAGSPPFAGTVNTVFSDSNTVILDSVQGGCGADNSTAPLGYVLASDGGTPAIYAPVANTGGGISQLTGDVTAGPGSGSQAAVVVHATGDVTKNIILAGGTNSFSGTKSQNAIVAGNGNLITDSAETVIVGGLAGSSSDATGCAIIGGTDNIVGTGNSLSFSAVLAGNTNSIDGADQSCILGGGSNVISVGCTNSGILAGLGNTIAGTTSLSTIIGCNATSVTGATGLIVVCGLDSVAITGSPNEVLWARNSIVLGDYNQMNAAYYRINILTAGGTYTVTANDTFLVLENGSATNAIQLPPALNNTYSVLSIPRGRELIIVNGTGISLSVYADGSNMDQIQAFSTALATSTSLPTTTSIRLISNNKNPGIWYAY